MGTIARKLDCTNDREIVNAVQGHLKNVFSVFSGMVEEAQALELKETIPGNKNFEKQARFYSTKKKPT